LAAQDGEAGLAAKLAGAAEQLRQSMKFSIERTERRFRDAYLVSIRKVLSEDDFRAAYEQGSQLSLRESVALALGKKPGSKAFAPAY
jgi:hypothetical protein